MDGLERNDIFDWRFYVTLYDDLKQFRSEQQARAHWLRFGRAENRIPNEEAFFEAIGFSRDDIPADFSSEGYLKLNPDIYAGVGNNPYLALRHYLEHGRRENRVYNPESPRGALLLAHQHASRMEWDKAAAQYCHALALDAPTVIGQMEADGSLQGLGQSADILPHLRALLETQPDNGWIYFLLGELLNRRGNHDTAMMLYQKAIELLPEATTIHRQARQALIAQGNWTALAALQQHIEGKTTAPLDILETPEATCHGAAPEPDIKPEDSILKDNTRQGAVESADLAITGWLWNPDKPDDTLSVVISLDHQRLSNPIPAGQFRIDRWRAGDAAASHYFRVAVPEEYLDGCIHHLSVRTEDGLPLAGSPKMVKFPLKKSAARVESLATSRDDILSNLRLGQPLAKAQAGIRQHGKLALCAMWQPKPYLEEFQQYLFRQVRDLGYYLVILNPVLNNSAAFLEAARDHVDLAICRDNIGYDFGSWITGLRLLADTVDELDELMFVNDSCYGPLFDMHAIHKEMDSRKTDFWGITDSWETAYHVQSYYVVMKKSVLQSRGFRTFCNGYSFPKDKSAVIATGEVALSQHLLGDGMKAAVFCPYEDVVEAWMQGLDDQMEQLASYVENRFSLTEAEGQTSRPKTGFVDYARNYYMNVLTTIRNGKPVNITHFFWKTLIEKFACPIIKRELVNLNPMNVPDIHDVFSTIGRLSTYDTGIIRRHKQSLPGALVPASPYPTRLEDVTAQRRALHNLQAGEPLIPVINTAPPTSSRTRNRGQHKFLFS